MYVLYTYIICTNCMIAVHAHLYIVYKIIDKAIYRERTSMYNLYYIDDMYIVHIVWINTIWNDSYSKGHGYIHMANINMYRS